MHYCYHNRIRQRIKNGELIGIEPSEKEEFAFVLVFRHHAVEKYLDLLN